MSDMKTPGVYVVEKKAFPNSVVEVATAVPAFIGYTAKAENGSQNLLNVPFRISSMMEFEEHFGRAMQCELINKVLLNKFLDAAIPKTEPENFTEDGGTSADYTALVALKKIYLASLNKNWVELKLNDTAYNIQFYTLYQHIRLFFANGGGSCYVVSIGVQKDTDEKKAFIAGIKSLEKEQEPTLLVIPEAINMSKDNCYETYQGMLSHCEKMKNRFAILDVYDGYKDSNDVITDFRTMIGTNYLNCGASYYPWLNTSILSMEEIKEGVIMDSILYLLVQEKYGGEPNLELNGIYRFLLHHFYDIIDSCTTTYDKQKLKEVVCYLVGKGDKMTMNAVAADSSGDKLYVKINKAAKTTLSKLTEVEKKRLVIKESVNREDIVHVLKAFSNVINCLPASAAMAGIYTMVDNTRGVWKAPANVSVNSVVSLTADITDDEQKELNASQDGKSINAIRRFVGVGTKVWGARTLAGNDLDWRYINVRRTMIFLEESIKNSARSYVFEANDANTWLNMKCMIENFLRDVWKRGGLAGTSPEEAYSVHIGFGETMTAEDILKGIMRISILVAVSHPAEFVEITFQQQMQKN